MFVQSRGATLLSINAGFIGRTPPSAGFALCKNPSITVREARIAGISYEVTFCTWRKSIETRSLIGSDGTSENSRMNPAFELWSLGTQTNLSVIPVLFFGEFSIQSKSLRRPVRLARWNIFRVHPEYSIHSFVHELLSY
jgi:hypothetical protein